MASLYFRQFLSGRDFAAGDPVATQMLNHAYAIGDRDAGRVLLVDPAHAPGELVELVGADGLEVAGVLATHHHFDHVGGRISGHHVDGIAELLEAVDVPVHAQRAELPRIEEATGVPASSLVAHDDGDAIGVGGIEVRVLHTPGHTAGSQCLLVGSLLVTGDTLFVDGCGRMDLDDSDPAAMYRSLRRLAELPDDTVVLPGHRYSPDPSAPMSAVRQANVVFGPSSEASWLAAFAGP